LPAEMEFINKNIVFILSLILSYAIVNTTGAHWPAVIHSMFGISPDWSPTKYKFPIVVLALMLFPIIGWLKKKLKL